MRPLFFASLVLLSSVSAEECAGREWSGLTPSEARELLYDEPRCALRLFKDGLLSKATAGSLATEARLALRHADQREASLLAFRKVDATLQRVTPAVEWAQSSTELYLRVKFAHKLDAPATLDVGPPKVECDKTKLQVTAESPKKRLDLTLQLVKPVDRCTFETGAVGRITVTASKTDTDMWPRLTNDKVQALHYWFDKQEQLGEPIPSEKETSSSGNKKKKTSEPAAAAAAENKTTTKKKNKAPPSLLWRTAFGWLDPETTDLGLYLADMTAAVVNVFDGWTGSTDDFVRRQGDRAIARARRNTSRALNRLKLAAADRTRRITADLNANISRLNSSSSDDDDPEKAAL